MAKKGKKELTPEETEALLLYDTQSYLSTAQKRLVTSALKKKGRKKADWRKYDKLVKEAEEEHRVTLHLSPEDALRAAYDARDDALEEERFAKAEVDLYLGELEEWKQRLKHAKSKEQKANAKKQIKQLAKMLGEAMGRLACARQLVYKMECAVDQILESKLLG